jgi:hypothetical protein
MEQNPLQKLIGTLFPSFPAPPAHEGAVTREVLSAQTNPGQALSKMLRPPGKQANIKDVLAGLTVDENVPAEVWQAYVIAADRYPEAAQGVKRLGLVPDSEQNVNGEFYRDKTIKLRANDVATGKPRLLSQLVGTAAHEIGHNLGYKDIGDAKGPLNTGTINTLVKEEFAKRKDIPLPLPNVRKR